MSDIRRLIVVVSFAACSSSQPPGPVQPAASDSPRSEWTTCATDDDCVAIEMGCCDHCNSGWVVGVNRGSVTRATAAYHDQCPDSAGASGDGTVRFSGGMCTEVGCGGVRGSCDHGTCTWAWDIEMNGHYVSQPNALQHRSRSP